VLLILIHSGLLTWYFLGHLLLCVDTTNVCYLLLGLLNDWVWVYLHSINPKQDTEQATLHIILA
jgi:hypothetical protein